MFNSREYEWSDVRLILGGIEITGIRGVKYTPKQEKEVLYAKGSKGHSVQFGNFSLEGSITVTQSELQALDAAGNGSLLDIRSITAVVMYGDPSKGVPPTSETVKGISFQEAPREWKQGDKFMECEIPFIALDLKSK